MADQSLLDALEAKREKYDEEGCWQRFLLESFLGCGGFQGRVKQPPAGWWGHAAEAYSRFATSFIKFADADSSEQDSYLDRHPREDAPKFSRRKAVAHYLNYVRPTTSLKVSYIVRKPHTRNNLPPELQDWITRTGWDKELRKRALTAAVLGWWPALVDKPAPVPGAKNAAEQGPLDPYVVPMLPCNLLDYELDERGQFIWAKTCVTSVKRGSFNAAGVKVARYTIWTRTHYQIFEVTDTDGNKSITYQGPEMAHVMGRVPLVSWRAEARIDDHETVKADSINADIAPEARRLFNLCSEFDEHIRGQAFALLVWPRRSQDKGPVTIGPSNGLEIDPDQKNVPFYLAPPGDLASTFETRIERSVIEIYRMARVEYDRASGTRSSAQSKEQNFEQTNLSIADFAAALAHADRETLILVGLQMGLPQEKLDAIECVPAQDFSTLELTEEIDSVISAATLRMGTTFKSELLKRLSRRLLPNVDPDTQQTIDSEIEAESVKAEQEAAAMLKETEEEPPPGGDGEEDDPPAGEQEKS